MIVPQDAIPAMFITTSMAPCAAVISAAIARTASWSATSTGEAYATSPPAAGSPRPPSSRRCWSTSVRNRTAPSRAARERRGPPDAAGGAGQEDVLRAQVAHGRSQHARHPSAPDVEPVETSQDGRASRQARRPIPTAGGAAASSTASVNRRWMPREFQSRGDRSDALGEVGGEDRLHHLGHPWVDELDVDLVVAGHAQPVDVRRADRRPVAVDGRCLRVHHRALEAVDLHAGVQQLAEVAARDPVRDDVVGGAGDQHLDVDPALGSRGESVDEVRVGDEVGVGHPDVAAGPVDRLEVHRPDREHPLPREVAVQPDPRLPGRVARLEEEGTAAAAVVVPEVGEAPPQVPDRRAGDPDVRVAPLRRVCRSDVEATDERDLVVDHQHLAVLAAVAPQVEEPPARVVDGEAQHPQHRRELLEARVDHDVAERVVDGVDLDAALRGRDQRLLEPLADLVALPDVGLEENHPLGRGDRGQHVVEEVHAVGVGGDRAVTDLHLAWRQGRERLRLLAPSAPGVHQRQADRQHQLDAEDREEGAAHDRPDLPAGEPDRA